MQVVSVNAWAKPLGLCSYYCWKDDHDWWIWKNVEIVSRSRKPRFNGRGDTLRWPRDTLYPQKLALTSPTSGGRSVGIVCLRTKSHRGGEGLKLLRRTEENHENAGCIVYLWKKNRDQYLPEYDEDLITQPWLSGSSEVCRNADSSRFCAHRNSHVLWIRKFIWRCAKLTAMHTCYRQATDGWHCRLPDSVSDHSGGDVVKSQKANAFLSCNTPPTSP
jgi:hypothetical protein